MAERKTLVQAIKATPPVDPALEKQFVRATAAPKAEDSPAAPSAERRGEIISRVPLTIRIRADYGKALKRASLERQLAGQQPNTIQDILEEALQPWLRTNGYLV